MFEVHYLLLLHEAFFYLWTFCYWYGVVLNNFILSFGLHIELLLGLWHHFGVCWVQASCWFCCGYPWFSESWCDWAAFCWTICCAHLFFLLLLHYIILNLWWFGLFVRTRHNALRWWDRYKSIVRFLGDFRWGSVHLWGFREELAWCLEKTFLAHCLLTSLQLFCCQFWTWYIVLHCTTHGSNPSTIDFGSNHLIWRYTLIVKLSDSQTARVPVAT